MINNLKKVGKYVKDFCLTPGDSEKREKIKRNDIVMTCGSEFVTLLKDGINNARVK